MRRDRAVIVVCGEALIDMVLSADGTRRAAPGGGPFNTAWIGWESLILEHQKGLVTEALVLLINWDLLYPDDNVVFDADLITSVGDIAACGAWFWVSTYNHPAGAGLANIIRPPADLLSHAVFVLPDLPVLELHLAHDA